MAETYVFVEIMFNSESTDKKVHAVIKLVVTGQWSKLRHF